MSSYGPVLFGVALAAVVAALVIPVRRRMWKQVHTRSGWADWRRTAATLSWHDRARIGWANFTGRAVSDRRLAPLAVRRGENFHMLVGNVPRPVRRVQQACGAILVVAGTGVLFVGTWTSGALSLLLGAVFLMLPFLERSEGERALRSAAANRELTGDAE